MTLLHRTAELHRRLTGVEGELDRVHDDVLTLMTEVRLMSRLVVGAVAIFGIGAVAAGPGSSERRSSGARTSGN